MRVNFEKNAGYSEQIFGIIKPLMLFGQDNKRGLGYVETEEESNNKKGRIITRNFRKYPMSIFYGEDTEIGSG